MDTLMTDGRAHYMDRPFTYNTSVLSVRRRQFAIIWIDPTECLQLYPHTME